MSSLSESRPVWQAPSLDVLAFRATASGTTSLQDGQVPGFGGQPSPGSSTPPTSAQKGTLFCDGTVFVGTGGASAPQISGKTGTSADAQSSACSVAIGGFELPPLS